MKLKTMKKAKELRLKYYIKRLHDQATKELLCAKSGGKFVPLLEMTDVQEMTKKFTKSMNETVLEVLGKARKKKQQWMTTNIIQKWLLHAREKTQRMETTHFK